MRVYTIHHSDYGYGWTTDDPLDFIEEISIDDIIELTYKEIKDYILNEVMFAPVGDEMIIDDVWMIKVQEMSKEKYNNLPEFNGW